MTLETLADKHRVRTRTDECGDRIIPGRRGHLWMDGQVLCAMFLDAPCIKKPRLVALGGKVWQGDISRNAKGKRVQDAKVTGIPYENATDALRVIGAKKRRIPSPAQLEVIARMNRQRASQSLESITGGSEVSGQPPTSSESS